MIFSPRYKTQPFLAITVLTLAILACGGVGVAPEESASEPTAPLPGVNPTEVDVTAHPAMPERRYLTLEYPPKIRAGDSDVIRLTLEVDDLGKIVPTVEIEGNVVRGEAVEFPNLYDTHHVIAEARFDLAGAEVRPGELISAPISEGQSAVFYWSIRPEEVGVYRGTVWLYLRFVDKVSGEESRTTVSAQIVEIEAVNFLGLSSNLARVTGMIGSMIGAVLSFPFFSDLAKLLLKRFGRKA